MRHDDLLHAIRAACDVSEDSEVWIFGSQAIIGNFPQAQHVERLSLSREVDMTPKNKVDRVDDIDGALGFGSSFDETHGYYVHGVPIDEAAYLPEGWRFRCIEIEVVGNDGLPKKAFCVEVHDLIAGKLARYEEKDIDFAQIALNYGLLDPNRLMMRIEYLIDSRVIPENLTKMRNWCERAIKKFERPDKDIIGPPYGETVKGEHFTAVYPKDPEIDGDACGVEIENNKKCRRRGKCPLHGQF